MAEHIEDNLLTEKKMKSTQYKPASLFWKGLPDSPEAIDIWNAFEENEDAVSEWLKMIKDGTDITITLHPTGDNIRKFRHIFTENRNFIKTNGAQSFGFGYPLVFEYQEEDPSTPIVAPLFIWNFTINAHATKKDAWVINRVSSLPIIVNDLIFEYLYFKYHIDLRTISRQLALEGKLNGDILAGIIKDISQVLNNGEEIILYPPAAFPDPETRLEWASKGLIFDSGFFGVFKPQYSRRFDQLSEIKAFSDKLDSVDYQKLHNFTLSTLDPSQKAVLQNAQKYLLTVVEGCTGTGKTHTLMNIAANALSLGQRCLVVSPSVASLKKIQKELSSKGLSHLTLLYDDEWLDKNLLLELLKLESEGKEVTFDAVSFNKIFEQAKRIDQQAELAYQALNVPSFGEDNWTDTVGRFLSSNRIHGKELLFSQLNPTDYQFSKEEYERLKAIINNGEPLFKPVRTLKHPLRSLHSELYTEYEQTAAQAYIKSQLQHFSGLILQLQHRYIQKTYDYTEKIHEYYEDNFENFNAECKQIQASIAEIQGEYGSDALKTGFFSDFLGIFSKKKRTLKKEMSKVWLKYEQLMKSFLQAKYFEFPFIDPEHKTDLGKLKQSMQSFSGALQHWRQRLPSSIQEEIQRLNSKSIHTDLDFQEQIEELEYSLDILTEEINAARIYQEPIVNKMLTIPRRQQFLEDIQEQIDITLQNLRDFKVFYPWQKFWLDLNDKEKRLLTSLIRIKPTNWQAAFDSWYFQNRLSLDFNVNIPHDDNLLEQLKLIYPGLEAGFPSYILHIWIEKRKNALKDIRKTPLESIIAKNNVELFRTKSPYEVFATAPEYITEVFPVLLATPQVASEVLTVKADLWDLVLIDDAQALSKDIGNDLLSLGKRTVVFGNEAQTLPDAPPTLFHELIDSFEKVFNLGYLHRRKTVPLIKLTNAYAINQPVLLRSNTSTKNCLEIREISGSFDSVTRTNQMEAVHIIEYLLKVPATASRVFPAIGIVTLNVEQRDLISAMLIELKQQQAQGHEIIGQLQRNGLGVFCIDEMEGQHFDTVLLSCTITQQDLNKDVILLDPDEAASLCYIELLLGRAREKLIICHSFENDFIFKKKNIVANGNAINQLMNIIRLGSKQDKMPEIPADILSTDRKKQASEENGQQDFHLLKHEIAHSLYPYLEKGRVHVDTIIENMNFPITIKPIYEHEPPFVILVGGFYGVGETSSFPWENQIRNEIEAMGLSYTASYSYNWWNNPRLEARRLASLIVKHDNHYAAQESISEELS